MPKKCKKCGVCCTEFTLNPPLSPTQINTIFKFEIILYLWAIRQLEYDVYITDVQSQLDVLRSEFQQSLHKNLRIYYPHDITVLRYGLKPLKYNRSLKAYSYSCRYLVDNKCNIYKYRPQMCRDYGTVTHASHRGCALI